MRAKLLWVALVPAVLGTGLCATAASGEPVPGASPTVAAGPGASPTSTPEPTATREPSASAAPAPTATPTTAPATTPSAAPTTTPPAAPTADTGTEDTCPELPADGGDLTQKEAVELLRAWEKNDCELPRKRLRVSASAGIDGSYTEDVTLTADSLVQTGLSYDGVVSMPTADGPLRMLKFSMSHARLTGLRQTAKDLVLKAGALSFDGDVVMYATKITGRAFGAIPMTLTPDDPPPVVPAAMSFTDVTVHHTVVRADAARATGLMQS